MGSGRAIRASACGYVGVLICLSVACSALPATAAAAPANDAFASRLTLQLGHSDSRGNEGGTIEPGERLTDNDPAGQGCSPGGEEDHDGVRMEGTLWWRFTGNGGPVTVSTLDSNFDTVLAVYEESDGELIGCNDDIQSPDLTRPTLQFRLSSELLVDTVAGRGYAVQVGGCAPADRCGSVTGNVTLTVSRTPPNDDRAGATPISAGPLDATNNGATLEAGEPRMCGQIPYAKTVWFRYHAPAVGTAAFSAAGFDTVLAVYRAGATTPLGCNDDAIDKQIGSSRLPMSQPPGAPIAVTPGDYLIQVGGFHNSGFSTIAARNGPLVVQVEFSEDTDLDDDGIVRGRDCDDLDPAIHPGARELANNGVDEDCDGIAALDRDGDLHLAPPVGGDCADGDADVHPGAAEEPGNGKDDNCDGIRPLREAIGASIGARWHRPGIRSTVFRAIRVTGVPAGGAVALSCRGDGCPWRNRRVESRGVRRVLRFLVEQRLGVGARVTVRATAEGLAGRVRSVTVRRAVDPRLSPSRVVGRGRP